jgi:hypothetical protein
MLLKVCHKRSKRKEKSHGNHTYNHCFAFDLRRWWLLLEEAGPLGTHKNRRREMKNVVLLSVLMVFGLALFSGCDSMTGRTTGEYIDDASITTEANAIIVKDPDSQYLKIDVSSINGNVILAGFIHDKNAEERIIAKIRQIKGVKSVKSDLKVEERK